MDKIKHLDNAFLTEQTLTGVSDKNLRAENLALAQENKQLQEKLNTFNNTNPLFNVDLPNQQLLNNGWLNMKFT